MPRLGEQIHELVEAVRQLGAAKPDEGDPFGEAALRPDTVEYLADAAEKSYDRQADLDESIWRSLPFFAAAMALAVTLVSKAADGLPAWSRDPFPLATNICFWLAAVSFAWALRWLWIVIWPRKYQYPPDDAEIWTYAEQVTAYYRDQGSSGDVLDSKVVYDLRSFAARQYGEAARKNLENNISKLNARSQLLLFMMIGFVLVIAAEALTYLSSIVTNA
jgi:hypothetical protein